MMRRWTIWVLLVFILLLSGCDERGERTKIVLKNFSNNSGYTVYATASSRFFIPGDSLSWNLTSATVSDGSTRDIVLLDETGASSGTYYVYAFADVNGNQQVDDGLDLMIPVLEVQAQPGSSVILSDISFDLTSSYVLNRAERFWIDLDYRLGFPADSLHPVYIVMQLQALGSDLSSPTANQNYAYTRLTDADAVRGVVSFLSANNHYMFAYYDANNDGIANTGDYGSETDPVNVSTLISPAGDAYITLSIGPSGIIP